MSIQSARDLQQRLERDLAEGGCRLPPVDGVVYAACAVSKQGKPFTLAVGHIRDDGFMVTFVVDRLTAGVDADAVAAAVNDYRVAGHRHHVEVLDDRADALLAEAAARVYLLLRQPPPPPPHHCKSWRHMLLFHRYGEVQDGLIRRWDACWKDGVQVAELPFDDVRVERLLRAAADCHAVDRLDAAELRLVEAELIIVGARSRFSPVLDFIDGLGALCPGIHPAARVAVEDAFQRMFDAFEDEVVVRRNADYVRRRVEQELAWDLERLLELSGAALPEFEVEAAHVRRRQSEFAEGYRRLAGALP